MRFFIDVFCAFLIIVAFATAILVPLYFAAKYFHEEDPISTYKVKCSNANGNVTTDTEIQAYSFRSDSLTFWFRMEDEKAYVVSGYCEVEEL